MGFYLPYILCLSPRWLAANETEEELREGVASWKEVFGTKNKMRHRTLLGMKLNEDECIADTKCTWNADKEKCLKSDKPGKGNKCMKLNEDECIADTKCTWNADKQKCWKNIKTKKKCEEKETEAECLKEKKSRLRRK